MLWFVAALLLSAAYLVCYTAYCFRRRNTRAAIGAIALIALSGALIAVFVSIMLQTA